MSITVTHIKPEFIDPRGYISRIIDNDKFSVRSILFIKRKKGTVGANHYHKLDKHFIYVLKGKVKYSEKNMKDPKAKITSKTLNVGDLVFSDSMVAHSTLFLENTELLAFSIRNRDQVEYEKDTVRVDIFD